MQTINEIAQGLLTLINTILVPLVFALAFISFLFGVFKYFFLGAADEKKRAEGRAFIMWAVIALAVMISVWGLVRIVAGTFGFDGEARPCLPTFTGKTNCSSGTGSSNGTPENILPAEYRNPEPINPETGLPAIY